MKRSNNQTLKEALSAMLHDLHLEEKVNEERLKKKWEELFGKLISKYTRQIHVKNRKLFLSVD
ncbi:MAG: DciA family protein, partial [Chitinophagales bacterium]